jgi:hypothetical protein
VVRALAGLGYGVLVEAAIILQTTVPLSAGGGWGAPLTIGASTGFLFARGAPSRVDYLALAGDLAITGLIFTLLAAVAGVEFCALGAGGGLAGGFLAGLMLVALGQGVHRAGFPISVADDSTMQLDRSALWSDCMIFAVAFTGGGRLMLAGFEGWKRRRSPLH